MADAVLDQLTQVSATNSQPEKADSTSVEAPTEKTEKPEKQPDAPSIEKPAAGAETATPVSSDNVAAATSAPGEKGTKVAELRDSTTPAHTKAQADALPIEDQPPKAPDQTDSAMGEAAKKDKAPVAPVAEKKDSAASAKEAGDDVKAEAKAEAAADATETRADDADKKDEKEEETAAANEDAPVAADDGEAASTPSKPVKTPTSLARRKSVGQKLNRKGSKARIVHLDAKPGDHYFVKLKGYPAWPAVICDEDMLPQTLIKGRPVTAARPDGTYREDYADGGKRAGDRTFPVMYLYTNEFGWVPNTDMHDLDPEKALSAINDKMRKDLQKAHQLAAEDHPLSYYKNLLRQFQEELEEAEEAKREAEEAKRQAAEAKRLAASTPKKSKKAAKEDVDMLDVPEDDDEQPTTASKKSKKRKAEEDARTPQRSDSVKKPKIKITSSGTPKSNGTPSSSTKAKQTSKASAVGKSSSKEAAAPVEAELNPEEKRKRKAKEVLFLRHKIQKGLLTRDQVPKEDEMKTVSDYLTKLEGFPDLEVGVIRETKINKVLKAILKIATIPREDEFKFKARSQTLLEKWNKLLAAEPAADAAPAAANGTATTNGNGEAKSNGVKKDDEKKDDKEDKSDKAGSEPAAESDKPKEEPAAVETAA